MGEQGTQFGRVPAERLRAGALRAMAGGAPKVYLALACFADRNFDAWPSLETLARVTGLNRVSVIRAIKQLAQIGAITVKAGGGRGHANTYHLNTENSNTGATDSESETVAIQSSKQLQFSAETVANQCVNSCASATPTDMNRERTAAATEGGAAAAGVSLEEAQTILKAAGIGEPTAGELAARMMRLGPRSLIAARSEIERSKGRGKGPGAMVQNLRAALDALEQRQAQPSSKPSHDAISTAQRLKAQRDEEQRIEADRRAMMTELQTANRDDVAQAKRRALMKHPGRLARRWETMDPTDERCDVGFRVSVARELRSLRNAGTTAGAA